MAIVAKQRYETDIDAFVVVLDSFCDSVVRKLYQRQGLTMPAYGNAIGGGAPAWLKAKVVLLDGFYKLHQLRIRSLTAHPRHLRTQAHNKRVKHPHFYRIRKSLVAAFDQLEADFPP